MLHFADSVLPSLCRSKGCLELSHQVIMVVSNSEDFVKAWISILSLTRCQLTTKFPARASKSEKILFMCSIS